MIKVLVTGAKGQLASCIKDAAAQFLELEITFVQKELLNLQSKTSVQNFFNTYTFDYCINTAAYTNVEKAESDSENAFLTNAEGVKYLAEACSEANTVLVHISTDYVFDGKKTTPYNEKDVPNPINIYGASKLLGEQYIRELCSKYFIFRTSWLYSQYGHNFLNSMLKFAKEKKDLTITTEQTGTPTNANDLAITILKIVTSRSENYGLYHFSNKGKATWFDFAEAIFEFTEEIETVNLVKTDYYRTFAARPVYSELSLEKFRKTFPVKIINWERSLQRLIDQL